MIVLWAATGQLQASFNDSGETQVGATANPYFGLLAGAAEEFHGSLISPAGDQVIAEFSEAPLAVRAAVEMQRRLAKIVADKPENDRPYLRVGLHQSSRETAARIAHQAKAGQILVTRPVREAVLGESDVRCTWQGHLTGESKTPAGATGTPATDSAEKEDLFEVLWAASVVQATPPPVLSSSAGAGSTPTGRSSRDRFTISGAAPVLQRFDILGELGRGGMGIVYKARDRETGETVAIKVLKPELLENPVVLERFKNEMRLARKITHKNICRIHDFHRDDEVAYISMEYVEGDSLRALLDQNKHFTIEEGLAIAHQLCAGLGEAHAQGVVHRDLKPQNVMLDRAGKLTIMDFGIARSVDSGNTLTVGIIGTPAYMAPEQAEGKPVDHRTDIYALGLVLYEVFTGIAAFSGETMVTVVMKQIMETPRPPRELQPSLPPNLERAILGCLEKSPDRRFASIAELEAALSGGSGIPIGATLPAPTAAATGAFRTQAGMPTIQTTQPFPPAAAAPEIPVPQAVAPPPKRQWWKTAIGVTAMGCAVPVCVLCLTVLAIVMRSPRKVAVPSIQVNPERPDSPAAPTTPAPAGKSKADRKAAAAKKKDDSDSKDEDRATPTPPAPAITIPGVSIPGMNIPIGMGKNGMGVDVSEIVKNAAQMKVQMWVMQGDRFMEAKKYTMAVEVYQLAAKASPDDQTIQSKLAKAREAKAAAGQ
jgi:hypothetical protein